MYTKKWIQLQLHLVHVKEGMTLTEALKHSDGLAVVGILLAVDETPRPLSAMASRLNQIPKNGPDPKIIIKKIKCKIFLIVKKIFFVEL